MKQAGYAALGATSVALLMGCQAGKQREEILANQRIMQEDLREAQDSRAQILRNQEEAAQRDSEVLRLVKVGVTTQNEILTLSRDIDGATKANTDTLDKTFREIYGVGLDLRSAIGETRLVVEVNNSEPLRVHSELPGTSDSQVVTKLPIGSVIFQSRKLEGKWWRGVILQEGHKTEVYFAGNYTKPLRDELMPEQGAGLEIGGTERTD